CGSPLYAAIPLTLLKGAVGVACWFVRRDKKSKLSIFQATRTHIPVRRPSGGVAQGTRGMDAERGTKGKGLLFVTCPRSGTGRREPRRSRGRMSGWPPFWFLFLGQTRATKRSGVTAAGWPEGRA